MDKSEKATGEYDMVQDGDQGSFSKEGEEVRGGGKVERRALKQAIAPKSNSKLRLFTSSVAERRKSRETFSSYRRSVRCTSPFIEVKIRET